MTARPGFVWVCFLPFCLRAFFHCQAISARTVSSISMAPCTSVQVSNTSAAQDRTTKLRATLADSLSQSVSRRRTRFIGRGTFFEQNRACIGPAARIPVAVALIRPPSIAIYDCRWDRCGSKTGLPLLLSPSLPPSSQFLATDRSQSPRHAQIDAARARIMSGNSSIGRGGGQVGRGGPSRGRGGDDDE
jgi:hypothetical protein